ncbi:MAG TPA: 30S ribosomal protein S7 [Candidatus Thermoplasmatota archaeon]|nr:30S ribosomal protein S7 [Candidatus Thermoplasmatota archaeon]
MTDEQNPANPAPPADTDAPLEAAAEESLAPQRPVIVVPKFPVPPLFGKYAFDEVSVSDVSLAKYINLSPTLVLHTSARHANKAFGKQRIHVVERLINEMMKTETWTGKKASAYRAVKDAFAIIHERTKDNPIQVLVKALENAAPREEVTRLRYGGISVPKAVDVAPSRRLDVALRNITSGAVAASHKSKNPIAQCIADEILKAAKNDMNSFAVGKKEEVERVAKSAR